MIVFGHSVQEWKRRANIHKWAVVWCVVAFVAGALIF